MKKVLMFGIVKKVMRIDDVNNNVGINGDNENWRSSSEFIVWKRRFKLEVLPKFLFKFCGLPKMDKFRVTATKIRLELLQHVRLTWIGKKFWGTIGMDLFKCCKVWKFYLNGFWVTVAESKLDLVSTWHNYGAKT